MTFDIRAAVHAVLDETDLPDPGDVAEKVAAQVPVNQLRQVLAVVLRDFCRIEMHRGRGDFGPILNRPPDVVAASEAATSTGPDVQPKPTIDRRAGRSRKVQTIREAGPRWLRDRYYVGNSNWKLLADCTYDNLMYLRDERQANADRSMAMAARFDQLAALLKQYDVERVGDLPAEVLESRELTS